MREERAELLRGETNSYVLGTASQRRRAPLAPAVDGLGAVRRNGETNSPSELFARARKLNRFRLDGSSFGRQGGSLLSSPSLCLSGSLQHRINTKANSCFSHGKRCDGCAIRRSKEDACNAATKSHGRLHALKWLLERGCPSDLQELCQSAAA